MGTTNTVLDTSNGIVLGYSSYLAKTISQMQFVDIDNLTDYLRAHLNIFFSEAISQHKSEGIESRINKLQRENEKMLIERAEIEEKYTNAIARSRAGSNENQEWINRCRYAFKMRGVEITNNNQEISRLSSIQKQAAKQANIKASIEKDRGEYKVFTKYIRELLGEEEFLKICNEVQKRYDIQNPE